MSSEYQYKLNKKEQQFVDHIKKQDRLGLFPEDRLSLLANSCTNLDQVRLYLEELIDTKLYKELEYLKKYELINDSDYYVKGENCKKWADINIATIKKQEFDNSLEKYKIHEDYYIILESNDTHHFVLYDSMTLTVLNMVEFGEIFPNDNSVNSISKYLSCLLTIPSQFYTRFIADLFLLFHTKRILSSDNNQKFIYSPITGSKVFINPVMYELISSYYYSSHEYDLEIKNLDGLRQNDSEFVTRALKYLPKPDKYIYAIPLDNLNKDVEIVLNLYYKKDDSLSQYFCHEDNITVSLLRYYSLYFIPRYLIVGMYLNGRYHNLYFCKDEFLDIMVQKLDDSDSEDEEEY